MDHMIMPEMEEKYHDNDYMYTPDGELTGSRVLFLNGEVTERAVSSLYKNILSFNIEDREIVEAEAREPIRLFIDTPGGSVHQMWILTDMIQASKTPVYTINMGHAYSAGALILMSGHRRFMMNHAMTMLHEGGGMIAGDSVKLIEGSHRFQKSVNQLREFVCRNSKITSASLAKMRGHDWYLTPEQCCQNGIIDEVITDLSEFL